MPYGAKNGAFGLHQSTFTDPHTNSRTSATTTTSSTRPAPRPRNGMQNCANVAITSGGVSYNVYVCGPDTSAR